MNKFFTVIASAGLALSIAATTAQADDADAHPGHVMSSANNATASGTEADNTARNERDQNRQILPPDDQSSEPRDLAITTRIRTALVADDTRGTNAKNTKFFAVNGHVTVRGPVANAGEHAQVVAIAQGIVPATDVHDEIEMKH